LEIVLSGPLSEERIPYQITTGAIAYQGIGRLPVTVVLENLRSLHNVGAFFRTADATAIEKLILAGITGKPPRKEISKTALGAEETVPWEHADNPLTVAQRLRDRQYELVAVETGVHSIDLFDWVPRFPACVVFGNELEGVTPELSNFCDTHVRIPMLGVKHSLNVATAGGVVLYDLLRKYRRMLENAVSLR
jgi:23S rRNA (guanosine2251-2'-O)-methyltransferase